MIKLFKGYDIFKEISLDNLFEEYYLRFLPPIAGGAVTVSNQANPVAANLIVDLDADNTSESNMTGTSGTLYMVDIDNTANAAVEYVKLYDAASPTIGTTAPDWIFRVPASVRRVYAITEGVAYATALSMACVTAGGTAGTTSPTSDVKVRLLTS